MKIENWEKVKLQKCSTESQNFFGNRGKSETEEEMHHCLGGWAPLVINPYDLALLPTASIDKAVLVIILQFSIGRMIQEKPIKTEFLL